MNVISFFDESTRAVGPWLEAGFRAWCVDMAHPRGTTKKGDLTLVGADIHELYRGHWWLPDEAWMTWNFTDCTYLTNSGNRHQRARGPGCVARGLLLADAAWRLCVSYGKRWYMENPAVGRLSSWMKPDHVFHPWEYAGWNSDLEEENTTKATGLWVGSEFVMPAKRPAVGPHRHDVWLAPPSDDRAKKRSLTPMGFARAVFEANQPRSNPGGFRDV